MQIFQITNPSMCTNKIAARPSLSLSIEKLLQTRVSIVFLFNTCNSGDENEYLYLTYKST